MEATPGTIEIRPDELVKDPAIIRQSISQILQWHSYTHLIFFGDELMRAVDDYGLEATWYDYAKEHLEPMLSQLHYDYIRPPLRLPHAFWERRNYPTRHEMMLMLQEHGFEADSDTVVPWGREARYFGYIYLSHVTGYTKKRRNVLQMVKPPKIFDTLKEKK